MSRGAGDVSQTVLWSLPVGLGLCAIVAVPLGRRWGAAAGYPLGALLAVGAAALALAGGRALEEPVTFSQPWLPQLGASYALRLDALSLVFGLLVLVVGALVLWYSPRYLSAGGHQHARYYAAVTGFAAAMLVVVLADDLFLLYAGWEATTVASFLLIAHEPEGREAARRALLMTFGGGLFLLAAVGVAAATVGSVSVETLTQPSAWPAGAQTFLLLLLVAAAVKSAQLPFHSWLPGAMVAPTPVSAYLHAAAMVKAGIYLLARFSELLAAHPDVATATMLLGGTTAVFAAGAALRRNDMKELLAYSTISQLGVMVAMIGLATAAAVAAAVVHAIAHALYKSGLFLVAGAADHHQGTRDLRELAGVRRDLPLASAAAVLCAASMAGIPPLLGYGSKEQVLRASIEAPGAAAVLALLLVSIGLVLTVAYSIRVAAPFVSRPGPAATPGHGAAGIGMAVVPAVLAMGGLGLGLFVARLTEPVRAATLAGLGEPLHEELGLWHGAGAAFWASVAVLAAGVSVWTFTRRRALLALPDLSQRALATTASWTVRLGGVIDRGLGPMSRTPHLGALVVVLGAVLCGGALWAWTTVDGPTGSAHRWVVTALILATALALVRVRDRLAAVAMLAAVDLLVATLFVLYGGADLVVTQVVVSALAMTLIVFVFRELPRSYAEESRRRRVTAAAVALVVGTGLGATAYLASGDVLSEPSRHYLRVAPAEDADNVVNAVLTDFRALDTLGETVVLAVSAIGVVVVIRSRTRRRT